MLKFSSILIGVKDLGRARKFYEPFLGVTFDEFRPPFACFYFDGIEFDVEEDAEYRSGDWAKINIGVSKPFSFKTDNLKALIEKAESLGGVLVRDIQEKSWGWKDAVIADPDGNEFIVEEEMK
ncbi:MAG: hypothetical protein G01um101418_730 [Parcubacteria group bacterium Gr01-1014_18]|nr:MAG: hypothetical protein Greene041636_720 [Parcubacteria group bacterium Greene0416_36]TSC80222.1 MAG: hypothetical protein G01um101418_730 [Parcubacteria group bacterium Gr01-1014_18]TSC98404.1 MAG: hypothetical protein Greene101420_757 [Parcubacteria group bacterium Greene1014_20]TSD06945.1 MAG: hypothetical protein Greene07142_508 [Parcubacteria group bacterium Greene0714_2]